jgi:hypothetical protein
VHEQSWQLQAKTVVHWQKLNSSVFQAHQHEITACDLQKHLQHLYGVQYFGHVY